MRNIASQYDKASRLFQAAAAMRRAGNYDRAAVCEARAASIEGRILRTVRRANKGA